MTIRNLELTLIIIFLSISSYQLVAFISVDFHKVKIFFAWYSQPHDIFISREVYRALFE